MRYLLRDLNPYFFYVISKQYMQGYSKWYFFSRLPKAAMCYYRLTITYYLKRAWR